MRIYESVLDTANVGVHHAYVYRHKVFIIRYLKGIFWIACHLSVQITYPGYSRAQITELFVFSYVGYQRFA